MIKEKSCKISVILINDRAATEGEKANARVLLQKLEKKLEDMLGSNSSQSSGSTRGGLKIEKVIRVKLDYSADQWKLFAKVKGAEEVAKQLNRAFEEAVNSGLSRYGVQKHMDEVMGKIHGYGASDTEPLSQLSDLLDKVFGNQ